MAKRKVTKTESVRRALVKFPDAGPKEIAAKLKTQGVAVTPGYVSTVKSNLRKRAETGHRPPGRPKGRRNKSSNGYVALSALQHAHAFIQRAGSVDKAREVLDVIAKLSS